MAENPGIFVKKEGFAVLHNECELQSPLSYAFATDFPK
jgi:hypothetical protein